MNRKITVSADCICDLGEEILSKSEIPTIYFHVKTDSGDFKDMQEITSENIIEYISEGGSECSSQAPSAEEFSEFFEKNRRRDSVLIHICAGKEMSLSYRNACEAAGKTDNVMVFDSGQISSGLGLIVMKAARLAESGMDAEDIIAELEVFKKKVSTTFITYNADYLYRGGKVGIFFKNLCSDLHIHPIIGVENGKLRNKGIIIGRYDHSCRNYIRSRLRGKKYQKEVLFITYAGFSKKQIDSILAEIKKRVNFGNIYVTKASATITANSGPETLGLQYVKK